MLKRLLLYGIILAVLGGSYGLYLWFKPVPGVESLRTDAQVTSMQLANAFENDEAAAGEEYLGKVLEVSGIVSEVLPGDSAGITLVLASDGFIQVLAGMSEVSGSEEQWVGQEVKVKGICTGATMLDVVLSRCILLKD